jgi:hypothetical protein
MSDAKKSKQQLWGSIGGLKAHGLHGDRVMLSDARRGFWQRFERQALAAAEEAGEKLTPSELVRRAERLRRSHMLTLSLRSAQVRSKKRATPADISAGVAKEGVDEDDDHQLRA